MHPERVLVLGCGSVAQCTVPLLIRDLEIDPRCITIVDMLDNRARVADSIASGVTYQQEQVTPGNIDGFLAARVGHGDLLLDLAWNIDNPTILRWCRDHGVRYLNTSVEVWDPYDDMASTHPLDRTLYVRHMDLRRMIAAWGDNKGATAVVEHGANPGLVSHFTKQALTEIAGCMLHDDLAPDAQRDGAGADRREVRDAGHADRYQGDPCRRTRYADHRCSQRGRRVRQHMVGRRVLRGGHRAGGARLGHRTRSGCPPMPTCITATDHETRSASPVRAWRRGCGRGCRPGRYVAWSSAMAKR